MAHVLSTLESRHSVTNLVQLVDNMTGSDIYTALHKLIMPDQRMNTLVMCSGKYIPIIMEAVSMN